MKIRGTAAHIADKYVQLSRDAQTSGDPVAAENYLQHAEHYYRILAAAQPQFQTHPGFVRADDESRDEDYEDEGGSDNQPAGYETSPRASSVRTAIRRMRRSLLSVTHAGRPRRQPAARRQIVRRSAPRGRPA